MLLWPYACAALAMAPQTVLQHRCTPNYRHAPPAMEMQHMWAKAMGEMERKQTALTAQVDVACGRVYELQAEKDEQVARALAAEAALARASLALESFQSRSALNLLGFSIRRDYAALRKEGAALRKGVKAEWKAVQLFVLHKLFALPLDADSPAVPSGVDRLSRLGKAAVTRAALLAALVASAVRTAVQQLVGACIDARRNVLGCVTSAAASVVRTLSGGVALQPAAGDMAGRVVATRRRRGWRGRGGRQASADGDGEASDDEARLDTIDYVL